MGAMLAERSPRATRLCVGWQNHQTVNNSFWVVALVQRWGASPVREQAVASGPHDGSHFPVLYFQRGVTFHVTLGSEADQCESNQRIQPCAPSRQF